LLPLFAIAARPLAGQTHPLEPLTQAEMERASALIRADSRFTRTTKFATLGFSEPAKQVVLGWHPGDPVPRAALANLLDWKNATMSEVVVDVVAGRVTRWTPLPRSQPWFMQDDIRLVDSLLSADPRWRAALARRGLDSAAVMPFPAPADGYFPFQPDGSRYVVAINLFRAPRDGQISGLTGLLDLSHRRVIEVRDRGGPAYSHPGIELDSVRKLPPSGAAPPPMEIRFPEGDAVSVSGHEISWLDWKFRFGVESRSGLVLYQTSYRGRSVLYRGAPSEMAVPYGDPGWRIWMPLDIGWVGLGNYSKTSLAAGLDVPAYARFFDSIMHDEEGKIVVVPRAVAVYERDGGVLWRHGDESRRARELVLAFYAKVDNYDYGFFWVFHQDGTLELELQLTGQMGTKAIAAAGRADQYGTLVGTGIVAPNHQHFFNFRLDLDVDGPKNRVVEMNVVGEPAAPYSPNGLAVKETVLETEQAAIRQLKLESHRMWKIESATARNAWGGPTAYALMPGENSTPMVPAGAFIRRHVGFVNAPVWVTPERDDERYAAGTYSFIGGSGDGLPKWTKANRNLVDRDVVLWYTLGVTHIPRPEDWPLMPVHKSGFKLVPIGFSAENPTIAIPQRAMP
jgi:primary-amine oxidase